jgi:hypothetical protein
MLFIGLAVLVAIAIIVGIVAASRKGKSGGYWRNEDS